jgi:adenylate cyclase
MEWRAPVPANDAARVAAVKTYHLLDTAPEIAYDEITELAAQICQCPLAVIGLVDETRDWKKSAYGFPPDQITMPRELSICSAIICGNDLVISPDLTKDERFRDNPLVTGGPKVRFYCGVPLINPQGYALGTLCVVDFQPRDLTIEQSEAMRRLSHQVVSQFELRRSVLELERRMGELNEARREAEKERERSDRLLLNILPRAVAEELRTNEQVVPRYHESITIILADFEGFSRLTEQIEPKSLIEQLDQFFSAFDAIAQRHRLEKLKTIGDAYMCVGGLPEPNRGAGRINVSDIVHNRVRALMECEPRGAVEVKNKAPIRMHFVTRIKPEFSRDAEGLRPNDAFHHECERLFPGYRAAA